MQWSIERRGHGTSRRCVTTVIYVLLASSTVSCVAKPTPTPQVSDSFLANPSNRDYQSASRRVAYFGDLHLHTSFSFDAYMGRGTDVTPDQAFQFARGRPIIVFGHSIERGWPLDFLAVTDHAENLGVGSTIQDSNSRLSRSRFGQQLRSGRGSEAIWPIILQTYEVDIDPERSAAAWVEEVAAANRNNEPGVFTALIGFEWIGGDDLNNHHNVIFAGAEAPQPFTIRQSTKVEDLWSYMEVARARGMDSIAIVNHPAHSEGAAFAVEANSGAPLDLDYARRRLRNQPLAEIVSARADHDSTPEVSPADRLLDLRGPASPNGLAGAVRSGLGLGLALRADLGINPFRMGIVGSSDSHIGLSVSGPASIIVSKSADRSIASTWPDLFDDLPGPLTGVWAEANTRSAIFAALQRREVFATSGPRIKVRFFGGWNYGTPPEAEPDWLAAAYSDGTPMGGVLAPNPSRRKSPRFLIWAEAAPEGVALAQAQVIRLSFADGQIRERIFDVANQRLPGDRIPKRNVLAALWEDREFDPDVPSVYYLRVLEEPTRRWTTIFGRYPSLNPRPDWTQTTQQRAWSSPIWILPPTHEDERAGICPHFHLGADTC